MTKSIISTEHQTIVIYIHVWRESAYSYDIGMKIALGCVRKGGSMVARPLNARNGASVTVRTV